MKIILLCLEIRFFFNERKWSNTQTPCGIRKHVRTPVVMAHTDLVELQRHTIYNGSHKSQPANVNKLTMSTALQPTFMVSNHFQIVPTLTPLPHPPGRRTANISIIGDRSVTTQNLAFLSYWYTKKTVSGKIAQFGTKFCDSARQTYPSSPTFPHFEHY